MSIFDNIRKKAKMEQLVNEYFSLINSYSPRFTTFEGGLYEMELTRAAIHTFATHVSKLKPEVNGAGNETIERILQYRPNHIMDTKKYLYRLATVLSVDNTAFIVPLEDKRGVTVGFYPLATNKCKLVKQNGVQYLVYEFDVNNTAAIELDRVGILNQFQYKDELFGESNRCLAPTLELMDMQNQGIIEGIKTGASIRFLAKLAQTLKPKDVEEERKNFVASNLSSQNNGGVMMFDQKYSEVKQIDSKPFIVNPVQMQQIEENVFNYFGVNKAILQNNFKSDEWSAYYEGKIEPFALELGLVHTNMLFTEREIAFGNEVLFTANRLQYMSNTEKLQTVTQLFDRGFITHNQGLEIFNMAPVEDGDKRYIRKEYTETTYLDSMEGDEDNANDAGQGVSENDPAGNEDGGGSEEN